MSYEIWKYTFDGSDDNPTSKIIVDAAESIEKAKSKIQEIIEQQEYKYSGYDNKNNLWWARHNDTYPRDHFFYK